MTYGDGSDTRIPIANWNSWRLGARGILTWLVMEALDVKRYPWHPDASQAQAPVGNEADGVLKILAEHLDTPQKIQDALDEIRRIYDHTQSVFRRRGQRTVTLCRSLYDGEPKRGMDGYATRVLRMAEAAKALRKPDFELPSNVLTSWCTGGDYGGYPLTIEIEHPVENIVWGCDVISSKGVHPMLSAVESGEWVIANRSLDGRISIPVGAVRYNSRPEKCYKDFRTGRWQEDNDTPEVQQEAARHYLDKHQSMLAPVAGYAMPHHHHGLLRLNWADRIKLAMRVLRTR